MPHVTLTQQGWKNFTGLFGTVEFRHGRSVESITQMEAERLGAITSIETDEGHNPSPAQKMIDSKSYKASTKPPARKMTEEESKAALESQRKSVQDEKNANLAKPDEEEVVEENIEKPDTESSEAPASSDDAELYTREQLEGIADKHGLTGLREVGNEVGAKSNSIAGLIDAILGAQEAN